MKLSILLSSVLFATSAYGIVLTDATITQFDVLNVGGSAYSTSTFITGATFACTNVAGCNGNMATLTISATGLSALFPLVVAIDGSLSDAVGTAGAGGSVALVGVSGSPFNFTFNSGYLMPPCSIRISQRRPDR
jgi:hypothetical protein